MTRHFPMPAFGLAALRGLVMATATARGPDEIIGGADNPYLRRWHLTPRGQGPAVYLHHFLRSDDDRALHDHPWPSLGVILMGRYLEHTGEAAPHLRVEGEWIERAPQAAHRVELLRGPDNLECPVWTLFLVGDRVREWGFHCPQGWRHWRDFTAGKNGELVGKGCGE